jgi:16S rRNA (guanine527-N7)-methyltransferase
MAERKLSSRGEFDKAVAEGAARFRIRLDEEARARLGVYFELVAAWNTRMHLVAPCTPAEFATRHVLESLMALRFMNEGSTVLDVGAGAGLPSLPCLVVRRDLRGVLVEASLKKSIFLREALSRLELLGRARVVAERFERLEAPAADCLTCRAIERFKEILPALLAWASPVPTLLLFGGEGLRQRLELEGLAFESVRVPESERRFLFVVRRASP